MNIIEKILTDVLQVYMSYDEETIEELLLVPNLVRKERVGRVKDLEVFIYSHDHNPPHFHVKTKDKNIDAKFLIATGEYISGEIDSKNLKRINAFYLSPKTRIIFQKVWDKRLPQQ